MSMLHKIISILNIIISILHKIMYRLLFIIALMFWTIGLTTGIIPLLYWIATGDNWFDVVPYIVNILDKVDKTE